MNKGNFKKLIRNLRTKEHEKLLYIGNNVTVSKREKGKESDLRKEQNSNPRKK